MPFAALLLAAVTPLVPLAPTGPWVVHMEENMCLLERSYPAADQKILLMFQPLLDLGSMELYVITSDRSDRQYTGAYKASIEPGQHTQTGDYFSVVTPKTTSRTTRLTTSRAALDNLQDGDTLHVEAKPLNLAFKIIRPDKARTALQGCIDDLKKSWGIDPAVASQAATPLDGNPARYFSPSSYPPEALAKGIYGRVIALLNVDAAGAVEHCRIVSSAGQALNEGTCKVALRTKFKPARDKDGKGLASTLLLPVRWSLPGMPD